MKQYLRFWGKSNKEGGYHLLPYHCLDVAAVGRQLLLRDTLLRERLAKVLAIDEQQLIELATFFLGIHDVGKFSITFQSLDSSLLNKWQGLDRPSSQKQRHDVLGAYIWDGRISPWCAANGLLGVPNAGPFGSVECSANIWAATVMGHHGQPVHQAQVKGATALESFFPKSQQDALISFVKDWALLSGVDGQLTMPDLARVRVASWWLAGLAVLCDWIGSNQLYFPYSSEQFPGPLSLSGYWDLALERAADAINRVGVVPPQAAPLMGMTELFSSTISEPTPLQRECLKMPLSPGPSIYLLEDLTGSGKTEAAMILVHRLISGGEATGLYFALPTMATANAMFDRMGKLYRRLYREEVNPSLVLAHSARNIHKGFRELLHQTQSSDISEYGDDTEPAQLTSLCWLLDTPKKALLANVGVGTIDQSVQAILTARHQSLRLLGLIGKVLVVDEVHAYDDYLGRLLEAQITYQAAIGGSVILLSATLPHSQRERLVHAFHTGLKGPHPKIERKGERDYPLITRSSAAVTSEVVVERHLESRSIAVERIDTFAQAEAIIDNVVTNGSCICWIRNSVDDARDAYRELRERHPEWQIDLFHARYALADRLTIEQRVLERFGKTSGEEHRRSQVLIATSVVEQSLDIDFDSMISDIAPIDLLIQRAGRLQRHRRDRLGELTDSGEQRSPPRLHIFAPEPVDNPDSEWLNSFLPKTAYIYEDNARLWIGLRMLIERGRLLLPDDARVLIEGVYGELSKDSVPPGLEDNHDKATGEASGERGLGEYNVLKLGSHYGDSSNKRWLSDERIQTRLGDTNQIYLAQLRDGAIEPLRPDSVHPWHASSLSVYANKLNSSERPVDITEEHWERALERLPGKGQWGVLLLLDEAQCGTGTGKEKKETVTVRYCEEEGLLIGEQSGGAR